MNAEESISSTYQSDKVNSIRPNIVALIPRGEVIRNFVHSGAFDFISRASKSFAHNGFAGFFDQRISFAKITAKFFRLEEYRERWLVRIQREILDMAHGRWLWSKAAQERWRLRDSEAVTLKQKAFRSIKKAVSFPFSNRAGLNAFQKWNEHRVVFLKQQMNILNLMKKLNPSLVFNGSHIHSRNAIQAVQAANGSEFRRRLLFSVGII